MNTCAAEMHFELGGPGARPVSAHLTGSPDHSGLTLAARITLPHFSVSSAMSLAKSAGEPTSGVAPRSLDHLVGARDERWWDSYANHGSSLQIDDQLQPGRKLHRQVARVSTFQDFDHVIGRTAKVLG